MTKYLNTETPDKLLTEGDDYIVLEYVSVSAPSDLVLSRTYVNAPLVLSVTAWSTNLASVEVSNATSYPEFHVRGPGTLFAIENHTTKQGLYFDGLELDFSDYIIISISPVSGLSMTGYPRLMDYLSPVSNTELSLSPGSNNVSLTYELNYERISGDLALTNFMANGLNAENTDNGSSFFITQTDPGGGADQLLAFKGYDGTTLAQGYAEVGGTDLCYLDEVDSSGVTGSIVPSGVWYAEDTSTEFAIGLASVVWKNRRWSIDEEVDNG